MALQTSAPQAPTHVHENVHSCHDSSSLPSSLHIPSLCFSSLPPSLPPSSLPSLEDFHLDEPESHPAGLVGGREIETHTQPVEDFGHSLFAG